MYGHDSEDIFDYSASSSTPMHAGDDGNLHDPLVKCTCQFGERLNNIAIPSTCRQEIRFDIRDHIQVYLGGGKALPFSEASKEYVNRYYTKVGETHHSFPSGFLLRKEELDEREGLKNITILDGKEECILEDRQELFAFLRREGKGKHVLLDEVPLTLGIQGRLDEMRLSVYWKTVRNSSPSSGERERGNTCCWMKFPSL
ncbi:unnamed protein product [Darwinula stevensoni]|uniref:Uncharacterized protein n=1 Tax=Darwinula stevensoni TaxID=69355 RepID=A0A7R9A9E7_9CRUS|nr:unnamed protein product [Darwinula stevensoni]CAG0897330.1 unnamed protein product [Darwinula stevensoni]